MEAIAGNASKAKTAGHYDKVWKDDCMLCFRSPLSPGGLYVNLATFEGFCRHHVGLDQARSGGVLYLHIKQTKVRPALLLSLAGGRCVLGGELGRPPSPAPPRLCPLAGAHRGGR